VRCRRPGLRRGGGLTGRAFASVHTCGKALAAAGAFVCGSEALRRFLINRSERLYSITALPPYFSAQVATGLRLAATAENERTHVVNLGSFLIETSYKETASIPRGTIRISCPSCLERITGARFCVTLASRGFGIRAIARDGSAGTARLRVSLAAKLTQPILADFAGA